MNFNSQILYHLTDTCYIPHQLSLKVSVVDIVKWKKMILSLIVVPASKEIAGVDLFVEFEILRFHSLGAEVILVDLHGHLILL